MPIPAKFRGSFESVVENLLDFVTFGIGPLSCQCLFSEDRIHDALQKIGALPNAFTDPESIDMFRTAKFTRSSKLLKFQNADNSARRLWRTAQCVEIVYIYFEELMAEETAMTPFQVFSAHYKSS